MAAQLAAHLLAADIAFAGTAGFYQITPLTDAGRAWLSARVHGFDGERAHTDETRLAADIADGAVHDGLAVIVNETPYDPFL